LQKYKQATRQCLNKEWLGHARDEIKTSFAGRFQDFRHPKATLLFTIQPLEADITATDLSALENLNRAELELELEQLRKKNLWKFKFQHLIMDTETSDAGEPVH